MAINQRVSIGILKNDLIYIVLEKDKQKQEALFNKLYDEISKNLVPVHPNRHYKRTKGKKCKINLWSKNRNESVMYEDSFLFCFFS